VEFAVDGDVRRAVEFAVNDAVDVAVREINHE
jgi:hypothetical protein